MAFLKIFRRILPLFHIVACYLLVLLRKHPFQRGFVPRNGMGENIVYDYTQGQKTLTHRLTISTIHCLGSILNEECQGLLTTRTLFQVGDSGL